jgi:hypothetical protein
MGMVAKDTYFIDLIAGQRDLVSQADALENGPEFMITIRPFGQNIENKV